MSKASKNRRDLRRQRLIKLLFMLLPTARARTNFIRRFHLFDMLGENCLYQPRLFPMDSKLIRFHNNVTVANDAVFITHDGIYVTLNHLEDGFSYEQMTGPIEVMDNVFIGYRAMIMPGVRIGPNAIIGSGSIVTKDVPEGTVVAGNPAKVIGRFEDVMQKQREITLGTRFPDRFSKEGVREAWEKYDAKRAKH